MAYDITKIVLGNGILKIDNTDVGLLKGGSKFAFGYDLKEIEGPGGLDCPILELKGVIPIRHFAVFRANLEEVKAENASIVLGGMSIQTIGDVKRLNLGLMPTIDEVKVEFIHTNPHTLKTITIVMWKAVCRGVFDPDFSDDFSVLSPEFLGIADRDAHPTNPMGYVDFQQ